MSEYQYFEFQAIDRPLTPKEMSELRSYSTRARITRTSFINEYSWGDFKGDADAWMSKYFDGFLYLANWGTRVLKIRLPGRLLDAKIARSYCAGQAVCVRGTREKVILSFTSEDEDGDVWDEGASQLASIISVRAELGRGDLRALYLGWLLRAQTGELDNDDLEPPVPAGLTHLSASLETFADFLRIDPDLIGAAAVPSASHAAPKSGQRLRGTRDSGGGDLATPRRRTVADLLAAAEQASHERRRVESLRAAKERARRERAATVARVNHLDTLAGAEPSLWKRVDELVETKQPKRYDEAVAVLTDLRDLAARNNGTDFDRRLEVLRAQHAKKPTLIDRLRKAGL